VPATVARQEHDLVSPARPDAQHVRRFAPGRPDALLAHVLDAGQVVDAGAADDAEDRLAHSPFPCVADRQRLPEAAQAAHRPRVQAGCAGLGRLDQAVSRTDLKRFSR